MKSLYRGTCSVCSREIVVGAEIHYDRNSRRAAHQACAGARTATPVAARALVATGDRATIQIEYDPSALPLLRALPGARWDGVHKRWTCSISSADLPRTLELAAKLRLTIPAELAARAVPTAQAVAAAHVEGLYPFQIAGVDHLSRRPRALLADEMGLGKTVQALAALERDGSATALVICPASLKRNWAREAETWAPMYSSQIVDGKKTPIALAPGKIVIVNYDILPDGLDASACTVIVDECQMVKNYKAKRSQRVEDLCRAAKRTWALTGTPLPNRPADLWGVLSSTAMAREVFGSWTKFTQLFGGSKDHWGGWSWAPTAAPEAVERLRRVMVRRLRADVLPDLPAKQYQEIEVALSATTAREIDSIDLDLMRSAALPPFELYSKVRAAIAAERVPALLEHVEEYEDAGLPLVVFSAHRAPIDSLADRAGWRTITGDTALATRQQIVDEFQAGKLAGVGLTIAAGGVGLTLTRAAHVLFVDLDWVPANNSQAEDRICRIGQSADKVHVIRLVSDHVLDRHVHDLLASKIALAHSAVDAEAAYNGAPAANGRAYTAPASSGIDSATVLSALRALAGACDGAKTLDGAGFSRIDMAIGYSLARAAALSPAQCALGLRLCRKYRRQLAGHAVCRSL